MVVIVKTCCHSDINVDGFYTFSRLLRFKKAVCAPVSPLSRLAFPEKPFSLNVLEMSKHMLVPWLVFVLYDFVSLISVILFLFFVGNCYLAEEIYEELFFVIVRGTVVANINRKYD